MQVTAVSSVVDAVIPDAVLGRWSRFRGASARGFGTGLINTTFLVHTGEERAVFQRLHPVFAGTVNEDIDAVTRHLESHGLVTPRVLPTDDGSLFVVDPGTDGTPGRPWRALTFIDGESVDHVDNPRRAFEGAAVVARFHRAVDDLHWSYRHVRAGVHDIKRHAATLEGALASKRTHRLFSRVEPLAQALLKAASEMPNMEALPLRHSHGDLKISNLLFDRTGRGLCLVDLDTVARMAWPFEMGDAMRSWCNPVGEDVDSASVDPKIFQAAMEGYASVSRGLISPEERDHLVDGLHFICVELAMRFLADALHESYFGWDASRFSSRGEHNLLRAKGQWTLAQSVAATRASLEGIVRHTL